MSHEEKTNQRSIQYFSEELSEDTLWDIYSEQRQWKGREIEIVSTNSYTSLEINNRPKVLLDNHSEWISSNLSILTDPQYKVIYYEYVSSQSLTNSLRQDAENGDLTPKSVTQLIETALTTIVVLDERIQKSLELVLADNYRNPCFSKLFIPPKYNGRDLDTPNAEDLCDWFSKLNLDSGLDYLLIHRSIKDKLNFEALVKCLLPKHIVFVSGGGIPPKSNDDQFYLPFSVLNNVIGNPNRMSKWALVQSLKSLRKVFKK